MITNHHPKAVWKRTNPVVGAGVLGLESDTGKYKIGDGVAHWNSLSYLDTGHVMKLGPFTVAHAAFAGGAYLTAHTLLVPVVGMVVHDVFIDHNTAVAFDGADSTMLDIGQGVWDEGAVSLLGAGDGFDTETPAAFAGLEAAIDGVAWPQNNVVIASTDPIVAQFQDISTPTVPPTAGNLDFYFLATLP